MLKTNEQKIKMHHTKKKPKIQQKILQDTKVYKQNSLKSGLYWSVHLGRTSKPNSLDLTWTGLLSGPSQAVNFLRVPTIGYSGMKA